MNILVLGNGFDLYHNLPTTYGCFLRVIEYLINGDKKNGHCRMQVVCDKSCGEVLQSVGEWFEPAKNSYAEYEKEYDSIIIPEKEIREMREKCSNNSWWKFLIDRFNKDVGWIDVESEISFVIERFDILLKNEKAWRTTKGSFDTKDSLEVRFKSVTDQIIMSFFDFFL